MASLFLSLVYYFPHHCLLHGMHIWTNDILMYDLHLFILSLHQYPWYPFLLTCTLKWVSLYENASTTCATTTHLKIRISSRLQLLCWGSLHDTSSVFKYTIKQHEEYQQKLSQCIFYSRTICFYNTCNKGWENSLISQSLYTPSVKSET